MHRETILKHVSQLICAINLPHPVRIAIDGIDAAGKTTFADELATVIRNQSTRHVIRASVDDFHNPKEVRYRKGELSPEGYYLDSFNYASLKESLLGPLGPDGNRKYKKTLFNYKKNEGVTAESELALADSILLFDGVFLLRPELLTQWDYKIFLNISFETSVKRGTQRGDDYIHKYELRYIPGQKLYLSQDRPLEHADIVIDNN